MKGIISWFARNGVAANLLMIIIAGAGLFSVSGVKKEIFPEFSLDIITIQVAYRGAAPVEVEEGVCVRIEEAVQGLDGIKRITSIAAEGSGVVTVEVLAGYDVRQIMDDVKSRVDAIDTFPIEAEKPIVRELNAGWQVINLSVSGETGEMTLKRLGEQVRDEILALPEVSQAVLSSVRPYEISVEVSEESLRRHSLSFDFIAEAIRHGSIDLPGGAVKTGAGEILLRTKGQAYRGREFEDLTLLTRPDGSRLRLADVARVVDGFEDTDQAARLDGKPSVMVQVFRVGDQSALDVAAAIYRYVEQARPRMPQGISLTTWQDTSRILESRMDLLLRNAISGLLLVFTVLALFLRLRLAFWVTIGIPVSFLGAIAMMPVLDVSINMISLFSFILVLGIVVDDAIVVGENIFTLQAREGDGLGGAIRGTQQVTIPVIFGVLTSAVAFAPMLFLSGVMGKIFSVFPLIIIPVLLFSLVESKLVLPHHLSHYRPKKSTRGRNLLVRAWDGFFNLFSSGLDWFIGHIYKPVLETALSWRYATAAIALATLMITGGLVGGGTVKFLLFPAVESDNVVAFLTMPQESPSSVTSAAVRRIEAAAARLGEELEAEQGQKIYRHMLASVGEQPFRVMQRGPAGNGARDRGPNLGEVNIELAPSEGRTISAVEIADRWRRLTGPIPDAVELTFTSDLIGGDKPIDIQLTGVRLDRVRAVAERLKTQLADYPGVIDITDSFRGGKPEVKLGITAAGESLGLSLRGLGRQVRQGFFGEEAQRIQRGRDDIRVMVRYPAAARRSLGDLERMRIRTPAGGEVPFSTVATAELGRGFAAIKRVDRNRAINVTAEIDATKANASAVLADLELEFLPALLAEYPGVRYSFEGDERQWAESLDGLKEGFVVAIFVMFVLMAIPLKSYIQPLIVLSAVPFGIVGAILGHLIMGMPVSMLSLCGVIALAGIVVNDSLVLVSYVNSHRRAGMPLYRAVREAGMVRFRPILLTSLTTAAGITPLMLEKSVQAQFLIPMAVALAYGVLFSTVITLLLVPASYLMIEDLQSIFRWLYGRGPAVAGAAEIQSPRRTSQGLASQALIDAEEVPPPAPAVRHGVTRE